jgi:hypothetical protein
VDVPNTNDTSNNSNSTNSTTKDEDEVRINWDNEVVPKGPWIETELFQIGDYTVTNKDVVVGTTVIIVMVVIAVVICLFISYRKRKRIMIEAARASFMIKKATHSIRRSIKKKIG